jgi:large subunit ribosomal protein L19
LTDKTRSKQQHHLFYHPEQAMRNSTIEAIEKKFLKTENIPQFEVGDTVDVATRIVEGEKERIQTFTGTVIMIKNSGLNQMFTVRRIVNNEGVERVFPTHSPFISKVTVRRSGESRRAKLFYLRDRVGKSVRLADKKRVATKETEETAGAELAGAAS